MYLPPSGNASGHSGPPWGPTDNQRVNILISNRTPRLAGEGENAVPGPDDIEFLTI